MPLDNYQAESIATVSIENKSHDNTELRKHHHSYIEPVIQGYVNYRKHFPVPYITPSHHQNKISIESSSEYYHLILSNLITEHFIANGTENQLHQEFSAELNPHNNNSIYKEPIGHSFLNSTTHNLHGITAETNIEYNRNIALQRSTDNVVTPEFNSHYPMPERQVAECNLQRNTNIYLSNRNDNSDYPVILHNQQENLPYSEAKHYEKCDDTISVFRELGSKPAPQANHQLYLDSLKQKDSEPFDDLHVKHDDLTHDVEFQNHQLFSKPYSKWCQYKENFRNELHILNEQRNTHLTQTNKEDDWQKLSKRSEKEEIPQNTQLHHVASNSHSKLKSDFHSLQEHSLTPAREKTSEGHECQKRFTRKDHLDKHLIKHAQEKCHLCDIFEKTFKQKWNLNNRILTHEKPLKCDICEKRFARKCNLNCHILTHKRENPHKCEVHQKRTIRKEHLNRHFLKHAEEKHLVCDICKMKFKQIYQLNKHTLTHGKLHNSDHWIKKFAQKYRLNRHMLTHKGQKTHKCDVCLKRFTRKDHLKRHLLQHSEEKPHECDVCQKRFTRKDYRNRHLLIHSGEKSYKCDVCQKRFTRKEHLKRHLIKKCGRKPRE